MINTIPPKNSLERAHFVRTCVVIVTGLLLLGGCATVTAEHTQTIQVVTEPAGAVCSLTNKVGSWKILATPATISVDRSFSPLNIECKKGQMSATQALEPFTRGRAYGNILMLGIPAYMDAATGAGYEYRPEAVTLKLAEPTASPPASHTAPHAGQSR